MHCYECDRLTKYINSSLKKKFKVNATHSLNDIKTSATMILSKYNKDRIKIECSSQDARDGVKDWSWNKSKYVSTKVLAMVLVHHYSIVDLVENRKKFDYNNINHHNMYGYAWQHSSAEIRLGLRACYFMTRHINPTNNRQRTYNNNRRKKRNFSGSWRTSS
jgi:hypothetical protein